jgi:diacylglycerol kinase (ATP)
MLANDHESGSRFKRIIANWLSGIRLAWRGNTVFRWMVAVSIMGIVLAWVVGIGVLRVSLLLGIACIAFGLEIANTSIEKLCDIVHPGKSEEVKMVKDAFSAVPIFAFTAYVVSWLILVAPAIWKWIAR